MVYAVLVGAAAEPQRQARHRWRPTLAMLIVALLGLSLDGREAR